MHLTNTILAALNRHKFAVLWCGTAIFGLVFVLDNLRRISREGSLNYALTDLLINYEGGMTRRGLLGQASVELTGIFGAAPTHWAIGISVALLALLTALCVRLYQNVPQSPAFLLLTLSPFGLLFQAYDTDAAFRKEFLGYLILVIILQGVITARPKNAMFAILVAATAFLALFFVHEAIVFLVPSFGIALWLVTRRHPSITHSCYAVGGLTFHLMDLSHRLLAGPL